jgi:hypothetical protein
MNRMEHDCWAWRTQGGKKTYHKDNTRPAAEALHCVPAQPVNVVSNALASRRSAVSNPSVNHV